VKNQYHAKCEDTLLFFIDSRLDGAGPARVREGEDQIRFYDNRWRYSNLACCIASSERKKFLVHFIFP
jgi:hypothetical protein